MSNVDLDLDAIVEQKRTVKLNGEIITIGDISLEQLLKLGEVAQKMQTQPEKYTEHVQTFQETMYEIIPEIKGKNIKISQLIRIFQFLSEKVDISGGKSGGSQPVLSADTTQKKTEFES